MDIRGFFFGVAKDTADRLISWRNLSKYSVPTAIRFPVRAVVTIFALIGRIRALTMPARLGALPPSLSRSLWLHRAPRCWRPILWPLPRRFLKASLPHGPMTCFSHGWPARILFRSFRRCYFCWASISPESITGFCVTKTVPIHMQARAAAIACYANAPLAWLFPLALFCLTNLCLMIITGTAGLNVPMMWMAIASAFFAILLFPLTLLRIVQWILRVRDLDFEYTLLIGPQLIGLWLFAFLLDLGIFPWCIGLVYLAIDSFR
jgi:hypothetical protein